MRLWHSSVEPPAAVASAQRASAPPDRLAGLDLLRFAAALAVVLFHFGYVGAVATPRPTGTFFPEMAGIARYGYLGVDLFFLISGFVIAATADGRSAVRFAVARAGRLYPAFVACMTATAIVVAVAGLPPHAVSLKQWLANLTMWAPRLGQPHMDGVYWTICLELVFYGWMTIFIATGLWQRRPVAVITVWLFVCFLAEAVLDTKMLRTPLLTEYGPFFASGILIHRIHRRIAGTWEWALLGFAIALGALHTIEVRDHFLQHYATDLNLGVLWMLHAGLYVLFAAGLMLSRVLPPAPILLALGGLTYPLYLLHQVIGFIALDRLSPSIGPWAALVVVMAAVLVASWIVWRYLEPWGRRQLVAGLDRLVTALGHIAAARMSPIR